MASSVDKSIQVCRNAIVTKRKLLVFRLSGEFRISMSRYVEATSETGGFAVILTHILFC